MGKTYLSLQESEGLVLQCAATIYAAHITAGHVTEGDETRWIKRSIEDAIRMAKATDSAVISDDESAVDE
jgi:hypothetical protein